MTTVITRLFANKAAATAVEDRLRWEGFPRNVVRVVAASEGSDTNDIAAKLTRAGVQGDTAAAYASKMAGGNALIVVNATYKPLGAARIAREVLADQNSISVGDLEEENYVREGRDHAPSVLKDHPRFFSLPADIEAELPRGPISSEIGMRLLSNKPRKNKVISGGSFMSRAFWPMKLISSGRNATSAVNKSGPRSSWFWPMPLLSNKPRRNSVIRGGSLPLSRALGWPPLSKG